MLNRIEHGMEHDGPPLVIAHGLFGSARNWGVIAKRLAVHRPVVAVDMRNHGDSPWDAPHSYEAMADDLSEVVADLGGQADVLGHSMGGKAAMALALTAPQMVRHLIVADIAPVRYTHSQMAYVEAMRSVPLDQVARRSDADPWLAKAVPEPPLRAFLLQSLDIAPERGARWRLNLDQLAADMEAIMGFPDVQGAFAGPATFIHGGASDYVGSDHRASVARYFPRAEFREMPGLGHWLHAEDPRGFEAAVTEVLPR